MPPKSTAEKPVSEGTRRSSRVAAQPAKPAAAEAKTEKKPASKAKPASTKKRTADESDEAKAPASKKTKPSSTADKPKSAAKPASTAKPKSAAKPESAAAKNGTNGDVEMKDADKATTAKPASKTSKPASKAKPASGAKPASSGAPKSGKTTTASKKKEETIAEEKEKEEEAGKDEEPETGGAKELEVGDVLPSIVLKTNKGTDVDVSKIVDKNTGLVFFLYPKADTPGCTTQACGFRDVYDEFAKLGYKVYGLSKDKPEAQEKWATKKELQYELLSDPESKLIKRLGSFVAPNNTKRSHYIFEKGSGKMIDKAVGVTPANDPTKTLDFIKKHHSV